MKEIIRLIQSTRKNSYSFLIVFMVGMVGSLIMILIFDNLSPITLPISILFLTLIGVKAYQQISANIKYNNEIDNLIDMMEQHIKGSVDELNKVISKLKERLKNLEDNKLDTDVREGLFSNKEKYMESLKQDIAILQDAKRRYKKEKSAK